MGSHAKYENIKKTQLMYKFFRIANIVILCCLVLICCLGIFYKHISFGLGLGDIIGYFILFLGTIIHFICTIKFFKRSLVYHVMMTLSFSFFALMIVLFATVARGAEYKWNGKLFYGTNYVTEAHIKRIL